MPRADISTVNPGNSRQMDHHEMAGRMLDGAGGIRTVLGFGTATLSSVAGFVDSNFAGVFASTVTLGGMACVGVYVAWKDRATKARIKADDEEFAAKIAREKRYEEEMKGSLQAKIESLTEDLSDARVVAARLSGECDTLREALDVSKSDRARLHEELGRIKARVDSAHTIAEKASGKVDHLKIKLHDSNVIGDDTAEHEVPRRLASGEPPGDGG